MTLSNAKASWNMQYIIGSIFTQLLGADNTAAIIGLISAVAVAVISSFVAISRELKVKRLEFENQKNLETVKFENEQKLKNLENELDLLSKYDIDLRNQRIDSKLWQDLEMLSRYPRPDPVTYELIFKLWNNIRTWYYQVGGIFLSENCRKLHFDLLLEIINILKEKMDTSNENEDIFFHERARQWVEAMKRSDEKDKGLLPKKHLRILMDKSHKLRTGLVQDIGTRNPPPGFASTE